MSQYGMADEPGRVDHWGVGLLHTFPDEGSAKGEALGGHIDNQLNNQLIS